MMLLEILVMIANADANEALTLCSYCEVISCTSIVAFVYMSVVNFGLHFGLHGLFEILTLFSGSLSLMDSLATEESQLRLNYVAISIR